MHLIYHLTSHDLLTVGTYEFMDESCSFYVTALSSFVIIVSIAVEYNIFIYSHDHVFKGFVVQVPHDKSTSCHVWWLLVSWKCQDYLSRLKFQVTQEFLTLSHQHASGEIMFLISHVASCNDIFKELCDFVGESCLP